MKEGDAVAVLGYPGRSYRSWIADEMAEREERYFPGVSDLYGEWIQILQQEARQSPEAAIAVEAEPAHAREPQEERGRAGGRAAARTHRREAAGRGGARRGLGLRPGPTAARRSRPTRAW